MDNTITLLQSAVSLLIDAQEQVRTDQRKDALVTLEEVMEDLNRAQENLRD